MQVSNSIPPDLKLKIGADLAGEQRLAGLLTLQHGLFVVQYDVHCLGVDCERKLIFNCGKEWADELSMDGFHSNGFRSVEYIYLVSMNQSCIRRMKDIATNKASLKELGARMMSLFGSVKMV